MKARKEHLLPTVKANSGVRARVPAAGKVLEGDDQPTLLREDQHYLHYIAIVHNTMFIIIKATSQAHDKLAWVPKTSTKKRLKTASDGC